MSSVWKLQKKEYFNEKFEDRFNETRYFYLKLLNKLDKFQFLEFKCPREESNSDHTDRNRVFYPLNYKGTDYRNHIVLKTLSD